MADPLRKITAKGAGTDMLECGHIVDHRRMRTSRARCPMCGAGHPPTANATPHFLATHGKT